MNPRIQTSCLFAALACTSAIACSWAAQSPVSANRTLPAFRLSRQRQSAPAATANAPRLVWRATLDEQNLVALGPGSEDALLVGATQLPKGEFPPDWSKAAHRVYMLELATGRPRWQFRSEGEPDCGEAVFSDGLFIVPTYLQGKEAVPPFPWAKLELRAMSAVNGKMAWSAPCDVSAIPHPLVRNNTLVYMPRNGPITSVEALTGRLLWRFPAEPLTYAICRPALIALGNVYCYGFETDPGDTPDKGGEYLAAVDLKTGKETRRARFYKRYNSLTHLEHLEWLPDAGRFVGQVMTVGPGVGRSDLQVTDRDLKPVWERPATGDFVAVGNTIVCIYETDPNEGSQTEAGMIGLDAATGRELWYQRNRGEHLLGAWNGIAVSRRGNTLAGIHPQTGATVWTLALSTPPDGKAVSQPPPEEWLISVRIVGKYLIIGEGSRTGQVAQVRAYTLAGQQAARPKEK